MLWVMGGIIFYPDVYRAWVITPVLNTVVNIAEFTVNQGASNGHGISDLFGRVENTIGKLMAFFDTVDVPGNFITNALLQIKVIGAYGLLALVLCVAYLVFIGLFLIALFGMFVMFFVGGICIFFAAFPETRFITWSWLRAIFTYGLEMIFASIVMAIFIEMLEMATSDVAATNIVRDGVFTQGYGALLFLSALCIWLLIKSNNYAASLTSGTSSGGGGMGGGIAGGVLGGIGSGLNMGGKLGGKAALGSADALAKKIGGSSAGNMAIRAYSKMRGF